MTNRVLVVFLTFLFSNVKYWPKCSPLQSWSDKTTVCERGKKADFSVISKACIFRVSSRNKWKTLTKSHDGWVLSKISNFLMYCFKIRGNKRCYNKCSTLMKWRKRTQIKKKKKRIKKEKKTSVKYLKYVLKIFHSTAWNRFLYCTLFAAINIELTGGPDGNVQLCRSEGDPMGS